MYDLSYLFINTNPLRFFCQVRKVEEKCWRIAIGVGSFKPRI